MAQFYDELGGLREMVDNYDKWIHTADKIADEAMEISRQLEQCRVKNWKYAFIKLSWFGSSDMYVFVSFSISPWILSGEIESHETTWESSRRTREACHTHSRDER